MIMYNVIMYKTNHLYFMYIALKGGAGQESV